MAGYNYYEDRYEKLHELHPERVLLGTETRAERIVDTMRFAREHAYLIGDFIWTLQDAGTIWAKPEWVHGLTMRMR